MIGETLGQVLGAFQGYLNARFKKNIRGNVHNLHILGVCGGGGGGGEALRNF